MNAVKGHEVRWCLAFVSGGALLLIAGGMWWQRVVDDPDVVFLRREGDAVWLRPDREFNGAPQQEAAGVQTEYRTHFECDAPIAGATLGFRALRTARVRVDGELLQASAIDRDWNHWQDVSSIALPDLSRGSHLIEVTVSNRNGPALWQAWCEELELTSADDWEARIPDGDWRPAKSVHEPWIPATALQAPAAVNVLRSQGAALVAVFTVWLTMLWWVARRATASSASSVPGLTASRVRWGIMGLWSVLAINNELKLPFVGFDSQDHSDYIRYLLEHRRLPLAGDGWQMFQAPLYHLVGAAIYGPVSTVFRESYGWHAVRLMTMFCGLLQVEVCYRAVRRVFPGRDDVQIMGTLVGGLMPMSIYLSQALGNEPLAGLLSATTFVIGLRFLDGEVADRPLWWALLGAAWGAAMLAKVTPLLLSVPLLVMYRRGMYVRRIPAARVALAAATVLGCAIAVCGWYYVRNWLLLGQPFIGGWDAARGIAWWQDPGYRVAEHLLSFGEAIWRPIYAGHAGLWDGLYSTMWVDGYLLGTAWDGRPPWNVPPLIASAPLAVIPTAAMGFGAAQVFASTRSHRPWAVLVSLLAVAVYLAAVASLYLRVPIYSAAKGTYLLGLLPCFSILTAAGCNALRAYRWPWRILQAALLTWATYVYAAYFII